MRSNLIASRSTSKPDQHLRGIHHHVKDRDASRSAEHAELPVKRSDWQLVRPAFVSRRNFVPADRGVRFARKAGAARVGSETPELDDKQHTPSRAELAT